MVKPEQITAKLTAEEKGKMNITGPALRPHSSFSFDCTHIYKKINLHIINSKYSSQFAFKKEINQLRPIYLNLTLYNMITFFVQLIQKSDI